MKKDKLKGLQFRNISNRLVFMHKKTGKLFVGKEAISTESPFLNVVFLEDRIGSKEFSPNLIVEPEYLKLIEVLTVL